jgi:hypothetical protein
MIRRFRNYLLYAYLMSVASGCKLDATDKRVLNTAATNEYASGYPKEINSAELQKLYDETKWRLYCIHCDQKIVFVDKSLTSDITFGQCKLQFDQINQWADSVEVDFFFYYQNIKLNAATLMMTLPTYGAVYKLPDSLVQYRSRDIVRYFSHTCMDKQDCHDRYVTPQQPEVIRYIKQNKNKIDPWFRKEAIKRGVINE